MATPVQAQLRKQASFLPFSREVFLQGCHAPLSCLSANMEGGRGKGNWLSLKEGKFEKVASVNGVCACHEAVSLVAAAQSALV